MLERDNKVLKMVLSVLGFCSSMDAILEHRPKTFIGSRLNVKLELSATTPYSKFVFFA